MFLNNFIVGTDGHCRELNFIDWIVGFLNRGYYRVFVKLLYEARNHKSAQGHTQDAEYQPQNPVKLYHFYSISSNFM